MIGFDSAWTDKPGAPGAMCWVWFDEGRLTFVEPELVSFDRALEIIHRIAAECDHCLVAIDQPTIVPNLSSMRPVDRVAASVISWAGGGVQPANRSKMGMFDDAAPLWRFKDRLGAAEDPEDARTGRMGLHLIEVFPALALLSINERFFGRLQAPRYNPARKKTFRAADWLAVLNCVAEYASSLKLDRVADWCNAQPLHIPRKADQDKLDSVICALAGIAWMTAPRDKLVMIGDTRTGYMISPASNAVEAKLRDAARRFGTPIA